MTPKVINVIFATLLQNTPNPKTELNYSNPFTLLVAVVLSAQATDVSVNKATKELFQLVQTPEDIIALGEDKLKSYIKNIGLYNTKAKHIIGLSNILLKDYNSKIPKELDQLEKLPGVGRKTANVVLSVAFNKPTIAVDTHVFRVSNRVGLAKGKTPLEVEKQLLHITPNKFKQFAHHLLILHGRYICKAKKPLCYQCNIEQFCKFTNKTISSN